jgi:hypothetical protein
VGYRIPVPESLPGALVLAGGVPVRDGPVTAAHLRYSDGVRSLALFVAPASRLGPPARGEPVAGAPAGARTMIVGAMRLLFWESGGIRMTLAGPLSLPEMLSAADAIGTPRP